MNEIWKPVVGYEGFYEVSNLGKVRSVDRIVSRIGISKRAELIPFKGKPIMPINNRYGYDTVHLSLCGIQKTYKIHRLVAQAFIPNDGGLPEVNHIDGNKDNNCVDNLQWCTRSQNVKHAYDTGLKVQKISDSTKNKVSETHKIAIVCNETGQRFESIKQASEILGIKGPNISSVLTGNRKRAKGYTFSYLQDAD